MPRWPTVTGSSQSGITVLATWTKRTCGMIDLDLGRIEAARNELEHTLPSALRANENQTTITHLAQLVRAQDALGMEAKTGEVHPPDPRFPLRKHVLFHRMHHPALDRRSVARRAWPPKSMEKAHFCLTHLEQLAHQYHVGEPAAALQEARGSMLLAENHLLEAAECFRLAAAQWGAIDRCYDQAHALASLGGVYAGSEDADAAKAAYNQAGEIYNSLGAQLSSDFRSVFLDSCAGTSGAPGYTGPGARKTAENAPARGQPTDRTRARGTQAGGPGANQMRKSGTGLSSVRSR